MSRQLAFLICLLFILLLLKRDQKLRPMTSLALWIPLLWIMIIGSRPVSMWFNAGIQIETPEDYLDGSPVDRAVFLLLIICGFLVLLRRKVDWSRVFASNQWLVALFFYSFVSVIWSDYPFVSFKRWTKELGNVVMVLIILTEKDRVQAFKAVLVRYSYFAISFSVLFIKYFPDIGRYYNRWSWEPAYCGITTNKNELGIVLFVCGLYFVWDLMEMRTQVRRKREKVDFFVRLVLMIMLCWLLSMANSSTSIMCLILGTAILFFLRRPDARRRVKHLGIYSLALGFVLFLLYAIPSILEGVLEVLGRDITFTGRTDLWKDLLKVPINPLIGTGYQSFWLGPGGADIWKKYYFHPTQAHNGFLEVYLNCGLIGLFLLMALILATGSKLRKHLLCGDSFAILRFTFLVTAVFYNWTEASFTGLSLVWIILLIAALNYPRSPKSISENVALHADMGPLRALPKRQSSF